MSETQTQAKLPSHHRFMKAWNAWQETDEFKNSLKQCCATKYEDGRPIDDLQREQHAKGSLWMAFTKGMTVVEEANDAVPNVATPEAQS